MSSGGKNTVLILLDSDVVIHLLKADCTSLLQILFPGRLRMLDIVLDELKNNPTVNDVIDNLFRFLGVVEVNFPTTSNPQLFMEYISLQTEIKGDGERATLLFCKANNHIIASSNYNDIALFCTKNQMAYLTTLDILA